MMLIKTRLRISLTNLMKIALESSDKLTDSHLEVVDVWNIKSRRIVV